MNDPEWVASILRKYNLTDPGGSRGAERLAVFIVRGNTARGCGKTEEDRVRSWKRWRDEWVGKRVDASGRTGTCVRIMAQWASEVKRRLADWLDPEGILGSPHPAPFHIGVRWDDCGHIGYVSPGYATHD